MWVSHDPCVQHTPNTRGRLRNRVAKWKMRFAHIQRRTTKSGYAIDPAVDSMNLLPLSSSSDGEKQIALEMCGRGGGVHLKRSQVAEWQNGTHMLQFNCTAYNCGWTTNTNDDTPWATLPRSPPFSLLDKSECVHSAYYLWLWQWLCHYCDYCAEAARQRRWQHMPTS